VTQLSIITINFNNLSGLKRTIESVQNQTWQEFEYIVIDGGSTDGSKEFIESKSENIDYWISEPDKGIYNAINKGIKVATGEYLFFINSGDHFFDNEVLKVNNQYLNFYELIYFNIQIVGKEKLEIISYPEKWRFSDLYFKTLCHQAVIIKKELFLRVGLYDENLNIVSDWKFFLLALFKLNCSYNKINNTLSTFYLGGISTKMDSSEEKNQVIRENFNGYIQDYEELQKYRELLKTNRYRMLSEIENSYLGRKLVSLFFRTYVIVFLKKKLKNILK